MTERIAVRPMTTGDVAQVDEVWAVATSTLRAAYHLPDVARTAESAAADRRQIEHKLRSDPGGSFVAVAGGRIIGLTQALVRGQVWVLSLLGVDPRCQDRGVGAALLRHALDYGDRASPGLILSSRDPRAMRRYTLAGFSLHPAMMTAGKVRPGSVTRPAGVTERGAEALGVVDAIDRRVRDGSRVEDIAMWLADGHRLIVDGDRAYAVVRRGRVRTIAATDEASAVNVLQGAMAACGPEENFELGWITSAQQWAIRTVVAAGVDLHPVNAVMVRGWPEPLPNYLPSGAFG